MSDTMVKHSHNWKGGRTISSHGYVLIYVGKHHHLADVRGYAYEHRLLAENILGRELKENELVHHINERKAENSPGNLEVLPSVAEHRVRHRKRNYGLRMPGEPNPVTFCACGCGKSFLRFDEWGRPRRYVSHHNPPQAKQRLAFLSAIKSGPLQVRKISAVTGQSLIACKVMASKLSMLGVVKRVSHGVYALPNSEV